MAKDGSKDVPPEREDGTNQGAEPLPERGVAPRDGAKRARELGSQPDEALEEEPKNAAVGPVQAPTDTQTSSDEKIPSAEVIAAWLAGPDDDKRAAVPEIWHTPDGKPLPEPILDTYEVKEVIPGGKMGIVCRVYHRDWKKDLAVKSVKRPDRKSGESDEEHERRWGDAVALFFTECSRWISLGLHAHIASCFAVQLLGGIPRALIEWVGGGSLEQWIADGRLYQGGHRAALARILDIAIQAAWGLHHLHEHGHYSAPGGRRGAVHQDVKPANILIPEDFLDNPGATVKVTDFGIAQARDVPETSATSESDETMAVPHAGFMTRAFRSPEQAQGGKELITRRSDVWSIAVTMVAMFRGGKRQWDLGEDPTQHYGLVRREGAIDSAIPPMPDSLAEFLAGCFKEKPDERPHDMDVFAKTLQEIHEREFDEAYPRNPPSKIEGIADALNNVGVSHLELAKFELNEGLPSRALVHVREAMARFEEALNLENSHPLACYNSVLLEWRRAGIEDSEAIRRMTALVHKYPTSSLVTGLLARMHLERDDCDAVIRLASESPANLHGDDRVQRALKIARSRLPGSRTISQGPWISSECPVVHMDAPYLLQHDLRADRYLVFSLEGNRKLGALPYGRGNDRDFVRIETSAAAGIGLTVRPGELRAWHLDTCTLLAAVKWPRRIAAAALSKDGAMMLVSEEDSRLELWSSDTGAWHEFAQGHSNVTVVALSRDKKRAVSGDNDGRLMVWDTYSGSCSKEWVAYDSYVKAIDFSEDGTYFITAGKDHRIEIEHGRTLVKAFATTLKLWQTSTGRLLQSWEGHTGSIFDVRLCLGDRFLISAGESMHPPPERQSLPKEEAKLWELPGGRCVRTVRDEEYPYPRISENAESLLFDSHSGFRIFNIEAPPARAPWEFATPILPATLTGAGARFANAITDARNAMEDRDFDLALNHLEKAREEPGFNMDSRALSLWARLQLHLPRGGLRTWVKEPNAWRSSISDAALSANGDILTSISKDGCIERWSVRDASRLAQARHDGLTHGRLAVGRRTALIAIGADQGRVGVCTEEDLSMLTEISLARGPNSQPVDCKIFDNTDLCACALRSNRVILCDLRTRQVVRILVRPFVDELAWLLDRESEVSHPNFSDLNLPQSHWLWSVALAPDQRTVFSGYEDGVIAKWDAMRGELQALFGAESDSHDRAQSLGITPDGKTLVVGRGSGAVEAWDTERMTMRSRQAGHDFVTDYAPPWVMDVAMFLDGRHMATGSLDGTIKIWDLSIFQSIATLKTSAKTSALLYWIQVSRHGNVLLAGGEENTEQWGLIWDLHPGCETPWTDRVLPYLESFLLAHTPVDTSVENHIQHGMRNPFPRRGVPSWSEEEYQDELIPTLQCAGYGWMSPNIVRAKLESMRDEQVAAGGVPASWRRFDNILDGKGGAT